MSEYLSLSVEQNCKYAILRKSTEQKKTTQLTLFEYRHLEATINLSWENENQALTHNLNACCECKGKLSTSTDFDRTVAPIKTREVHTTQAYNLQWGQHNNHKKFAYSHTITWSYWRQPHSGPQFGNCNQDQWRLVLQS